MLNGLGLEDNVKMIKAKKRALETASVSQEEEHQPTVVTSADGANILKELDTLVNKLENLSNRSNTYQQCICHRVG